MSQHPPDTRPEAEDRAPESSEDGAVPADESPKEIGGRQGPDPTRYGDWEKGGRCIDF